MNSSITIMYEHTSGNINFVQQMRIINLNLCPLVSGTYFAVENL